jgi:cytochrome P450
MCAVCLCLYGVTVLRETLRLWPPAPILGREATADHVIGEGTDRPLKIPKGQDCICNVLYVYRMQRVSLASSFLILCDFSLC